MQIKSTLIILFLLVAFSSIGSVSACVTGVVLTDDQIIPPAPGDNSNLNEILSEEPTTPVEAPVTASVVAPVTASVVAPVTVLLWLRLLFCCGSGYCFCCCSGYCFCCVPVTASVVSPVTSSVVSPVTYQLLTPENLKDNIITTKISSVSLAINSPELTTSDKLNPITKTDTTKSVILPVTNNSQSKTPIKEPEILQQL